MAWFDIALIVLLALSAILAFFRGLVTEALHLAALGGAVVATIVGYPYIAPWLGDKIGSKIVADIFGNVVIFIAVLLVLRMIANFVGRRVRQSELGIVDRSLGAIFGLARGFLIVVFFYVLFVRLWQPERNPEFIQEARMGAFVTSAAAFIDPYLDAEKLEGLLDRARQVLPTPPSADEPQDKPAPREEPVKAKATPADTGYTDVERKALDKAIDTTLDTVLERMRGTPEEEEPAEEPPQNR